MTDTPAPTTEQRWLDHDDSCQCHIGVCPDCGCTNEARSTPAETQHASFSLKQCDQCWALHESAPLTRYCPACGSENRTIIIDNGGRWQAIAAEYDPGA